MTTVDKTSSLVEEMKQRIEEAKRDKLEVCCCIFIIKIANKNKIDAESTIIVEGEKKEANGHSQKIEMETAQRCSRMFLSSHAIKTADTNSSRNSNDNKTRYFSIELI